MKTREVCLIAGARPNFMKVGPIVRALEARRRGTLRPYLVHTGQHYDAPMSGRHWEDLRLPAPDRHLGVGSGTHAEQTARVMARLEPILRTRRPLAVVVVGDVNSTLAAALTAAKLQIPVAHVEAGLRSRDWTMPEEVNRIVTDSVSDLLFTHSPEAGENLKKEGVAREKIKFVGNVMIDTLDQLLPEALKFPPPANGPYGLATLHRPGNVDDRAILRSILGALDRLSRSLPLYFSVHPRTARQLRDARIVAKSGRLHLVEPLSYLRFLAAMARAALVLTDSGGIQEETTALGVPCLTLRDTTERPITVTRGTNRIVGNDPNDIVAAAEAVLQGGRTRRVGRPPLWDGRASERIAKVLDEELL